MLSDRDAGYVAATHKREMSLDNLKAPDLKSIAPNAQGFLIALHSLTPGLQTPFMALVYVKQMRKALTANTKTYITSLL
jgi:hypothetical protein